MGKLPAALRDLACGLLVVALLYGDATVLLGSPRLVLLVLPLAALVTVALGAWRGGASALASWLVVILVNLPAVLVVLATMGRSPWLLALPAIGLAGAAAGVAAARMPALRRRWGVALAGLALALVVLGALGPRFAVALVASSEVREAPVPFRVAVPGGAPVAAADLRGRVAVIAFWATWCAPCQHELPMLDALYRRAGGDPRVAFLAVDVPMSDAPGEGDTPERAAAFFRQRGFHLPLAFDAGGEASRALRAHGLPTLLVLDRTGRVRLRHTGYVGAEDLGETLRNTIARLLAESAG